MEQPRIKDIAQNNQIYSTISDKLFNKGIIYLTDTITEDTTNSINQQILYLLTNPPENNTIQIYINSYGGCVYAGLGIYDMMKYAEKKGFIIKTVCIGTAMSMAALLMAAGTKGHRYALPTSTFMLHELSGGNWGKLSDMKVNFQESERLQQLLNKIITEETDNIITELPSIDKYYSTSSAIDNKIIDNIL